jgi:hypothetical protein
MKNVRLSLWLLLASQVILLLSGLIQRPSSWTMTILSVFVPLVVIAVLGLMLAGYISPGKR